MDTLEIVRAYPLIGEITDSAVNTVTKKRERWKNKGKHHHFPLKAGSYRATLPTHDHRLEEPYLLDPIVISDTLLITFDDKGFAIPNPTYPKKSWKNDRAEESIELYHLNYHLIVEAREVLWKRVQYLVLITDDLIKEARESPMIKKDIEDRMRELKGLVKRSSEFSSTAIASLNSCGIK